MSNLDLRRELESVDASDRRLNNRALQIVDAISRRPASQRCSRPRARTWSGPTTAPAPQRSFKPRARGRTCTAEDGGEETRSTLGLMWLHYAEPGDPGTGVWSRKEAPHRRGHHLRAYRTVQVEHAAEVVSPGGRDRPRPQHPARQRLSDDELLLTPSGCHLGFLQPNDLIVTDPAGKLVRGERPPTSEYLCLLNTHPTAIFTP